MNLFALGSFILRSGEPAEWRINCEALTAQDYEALALIGSRMLPSFGAVESVPRGGIPFAEALRRHSTEGPLLIAEDVATTGGSMEAIRAGRAALGISIFARGRLPTRIRSIWRMGP